MVGTSSDQHREDWKVILHGDFISEFKLLEKDVRRNLLAAATGLKRAGPKTGRPHVDTLQGSRHANMKELRFTAKSGSEVWRAAFAFDPLRAACILVAGAKQGRSGTQFYKELIRVADQRFDAHLAELAESTTMISNRS